MSEFHIMRVERWGERRSAVRSFGLSSVTTGLALLVRPVRFGNHHKHMGDPAHLIVPFRGFKYNADFQLVIQNLCVRYKVADKEVSLLNNSNTIPLLGLFDFCTS